MPTPTYTPLANITLGSSAASVTFSSISQAYRDYIVVCLLGGTTTLGLNLRLNGDTASNYSWVYMAGDGTATPSGTSSNTFAALSSYATIDTTVSNVTKIEILDATATDKHKTMLSRMNRASGGTNATASRWASTSAVNTVLLYPSTGSFAAGSTFALYGIAA